VLVLALALTLEYGLELVLVKRMSWC
jgi:hypothetical protein